MKKIITLIFWLIILILLNSCSSEEKEKTNKYYSTGSVFSGSISLENSYIWYIEWKEMLELSVKTWWKISHLYVKEWDFVKKGDLLAKVDSPEANVWYTTSESIIISLITMQKSTSKMFDGQISAMEAKIKQIKIWEEWINNGLEDSINIRNSQLEIAKTWVETIKTKLNHTKIVLETKENYIYENSKNAIVQAIILDTNIIKFIDELLGVTVENKDKNDSFEDYLSAKDARYLNEAKSQFIDLNKKYLEYKSFYDLNIEWKNPDREIILKWLKDGEELAESFKITLNVIYDVLDNSIENVNFSLDTINNYKNVISNFWNNMEANLLTVSWDYILWLKWSRQNLDNFQKEYSMEIDLIEKELILAKNTLSQYESIKKWEIREIETKKSIAISQFDEIESWILALKKQKETSLNEIQVKINEAVGQKKSALVMINNGELRSAIDWVVIWKMVEVWQVVWAWVTIFKIWNNNDLVLNINIAENIAKNIDLFEDVLLEIDWLNQQIKWKITNIYPSKNLVTKKIWIEISLKNIWNKIKIWSLTKVIFNSNLNNKWTIISNSAIVSEFMIPWVYVLKEWVVKFKNIEIIKQNNLFSEIIWLNIWEVIITEWKSNIWDWEILK